MTVALATILAGVSSVGLTGGITLWLRRSTGSEAHSQMVTATTLLLAQLQTRVAALEGRLTTLESEIEDHEESLRQYEALFGPLPTQTQGVAQ